MFTKHGILTLAATLALAACASDNTWREPNSTGVDTTHYNATMTTDNTQAPAVNDKNRQFSYLSEADMRFLQAAQGSGSYEVSAGQKALLKSNDPQVKSLAQHIVDDHTKANLQLNNLANRKGMATAAMMNNSQIDMLSQLDRATGADFDRQYLSQQVTAHQDAISIFESASVNANDRDIRDFASATLPTLRDHLNMVQSHQRTLGIDTGLRTNDSTDRTTIDRTTPVPTPSNTGTNTNSGNPNSGNLNNNTGGM
jgi:putative membrane protein